MRQKITIIGAGIGGCFLSILFAKRGYTVEIYEKFLESEIASEATKKSFALTLYGYGITILKKEGLWDSLSSIFVRLKGSRTVVGHHTKPVVDPVGNAPFYAVSRAKLLKRIISLAKKYPSISFYFGKELKKINREKKTIEVQDVSSKKIQTIFCPVIFGADGVHSKVRQLLQIGKGAKQKKDYLEWTYKQVQFNKDLAKKISLLGNYSQNWTRKKTIFVAYPNLDMSYSGMFLLPQNTSEGFSALQTKETIQQFITRFFPDFIPALSQITNAFLHHPEGRLITIKTVPWYYKDFIAILGDAAHAFPPFYGQGVSAAFADSMALVRLVEKHGEDWGKIFPLYQEERKKNTDALADLSNATLENYRREKRADYRAVYAKIESLLHGVFPKAINPPPFARVAADQPNASKYVQVHNRQRTLAKYIGIPLLIAAITGIVAIHELFAQRKINPAPKR